MMAIGDLRCRLRSARPSGAGGGLTSPRGITAARPPFYRLRIWVRLLGFVDLGNFGDLKCVGLVLDGSQGRLEAFCTLLGRP